MFLRKSIKVPLYAGYFDIVVMDDVNEYNRIYDDTFHTDDVYAHAIGDIQTKRDNFQRWVIVLNFNNTFAKITHGIIAHEALHLTSYILDNVGQDFDHDNHECFTYLIQWITDEVYKFLNQHNLEVCLKAY